MTDLEITVKMHEIRSKALMRLISMMHSGAKDAWLIIELKNIASDTEKALQKLETA